MSRRPGRADWWLILVLLGAFVVVFYVLFARLIFDMIGW